MIELLEAGLRSHGVRAALAVALVHQELVIVDGQNVADGGLGGRVQLIGVFAGGAGLDVDRHDARHAALHVPAVLEQRTLHRAHQCLAVRRDGQSFHALVRDPARGVAADFGAPIALRLLIANFFGKREHAASLAGQPVELVDVRPVLVRDVDVAAIVRHPDALAVEPGVVGVGRGARRVEVVRSPGEIVCAIDGVQSRHAAAGDAAAGAVDERAPARQQRRAHQHRRQRKRKRRAGIARREGEMQGMKAIDIGDRVVHARVVRDRVRAAIREAPETSRLRGRSSRNRCRRADCPARRSPAGRRFGSRNLRTAR